MATTQSDIKYEAPSQGTAELNPIRSSSDQPDTTTEQLCLLSDSHARDILAVLARGPECGRALAEACDISRATVYRRLNRLEAAGFVTAELCPDPNGHHRKEFYLIRDRLRVEITDGSIAVTLHSDVADSPNDDSLSSTAVRTEKQ